MPEQEREPPWQVHSSDVINNELRRLQRRAAREGRGDQMLTALRHIAQLLHHDPTTTGEPLFRLSELCMQVRTVVIRPLAIDFAVCEDHPLVFIKTVSLLPKHDSR
jgi:hypothetical protein